MKITLDALQILDAIEMRGSFAAAAEVLHRVPSALTHAMRRLEDDLGVQLFVRSGRRAVLTPAGRTLLEEGRYLLRDAAELEAQVQRVAKGWETELRIAVEGLIDIALLLPLVAEFDREQSGTRLRFSSEVLNGAWDAVLSGRADMIVGALGEPPISSGLALQPIGTVNMVFAVAPSHPLAIAPEPLSPEQIARYRAIVVADTSRELASRSYGLQSGQETLAVPDMNSKLAAQIAGLGVGHMPRALALREQAKGTLIIKQTEENQPFPMYLAWRSSHKGKALAWFRKRLSEAGTINTILRNLQEL